MKNGTFVKVPEVAASTGQHRTSLQTPGHPNPFHWRGLRPLQSRADIYQHCFKQIFNEVLVTNSIGYLKKCRRMSDEVTKMSLLEMKQAWASSRFFTNNPINKREQKSPSSSHSVVVSLKRKSLTLTPILITWCSVSAPWRGWAAGEICKTYWGRKVREKREQYIYFIANLAWSIPQRTKNYYWQGRKIQKLSPSFYEMQI